MPPMPVGQRAGAAARRASASCGSGGRLKPCVLRHQDEKELLEDSCCPIHRKPCAERKEANYFFKLSKYQKELEDLVENTDFVQPASRCDNAWAGLGWAWLGWAWLGWAGLGLAGLGWDGLGWAALGGRQHRTCAVVEGGMGGKEDGAAARALSLRQPRERAAPLAALPGGLDAAQRPRFVRVLLLDARRNEVLGWVKEGARDFSISRAAVEWGIPISRDPKQTVYVWFDALTGPLPLNALHCIASRSMRGAVAASVAAGVMRSDPAVV